MLDAGKYLSVESLPDGRRVEIRALNQDDRAEFVGAIDRMSAGSLYRRFFSVKRNFMSPDVAPFFNIDFDTHVALVAIVEEAERPRIVGAGRYMVTQPGRAEIAFAVIDQYQRQGVGQALMHHLAAIARQSGLSELFAEVLPDNVAMLKVFEKSGYAVAIERDLGVMTVIIDLGNRDARSERSEL